MKKLIITALTLFLLTPFCYADEKKNESPSFWEQIRTKIEKITPKKKPAATTAVGGVRGAKHSGEELYWKGEEKISAVDAEELSAFKDALFFIEFDEKQKALELFEEFVKDYPESTLAGDAKNAILELTKTAPGKE